MSDKKQTKALVNVMDEETMLALQESYPVEQGANRIFLPRLGMVSQDQMEGKGKNMKVVTEAGTFFIEKQTDEEDENGKKVWEREEIGTEFEGIILFKRNQLKMYDESTETYTSSPIYDREDEVVPLFCNKAEVKRGTPAELKAEYQYTDENGKTKSKLEDNRVLYVQYNDEIFQLNLRGSSMYSFLTYAKKTLPPSVITVFSSEPKEKGKISWNQMTFTAKRNLSQKEAEEVVTKVREIKRAVELEKAQYNAIDVEVVKSRNQAEEDFKKF